MCLSLIVDKFDAAPLHTFSIGLEERSNNFHICFYFDCL